MKNGFSLVVLILLVAAGCMGQKEVVHTDAQKTALRRLLDARFLMPIDNQEKIYAVLDAFSKKRNDGEMVYRIFFENYPETEATLYFSDGGMHGGGQAHFKKTGGRWVQDDKAWYL